MKTLAYLGARLRETSTYAGLGNLLGFAVMFHFLPQDAVAPIVKDVTMIGMGLGNLVAIFLPDGHLAKWLAAVAHRS